MSSSSSWRSWDFALDSSPALWNGTRTMAAVRL